MTTAPIPELRTSPGSGATAPFEALGRSIADRWRRVHYDERCFAELSHQSLCDARLHTQVRGLDLLRWGATTEGLPAQLDPSSRFGEPPLTLFSHPRFVIDLYPWFSSTTSIHQHSFSGAFFVLEGGSVHCRYRFHTHHIVNARMRVGELGLSDVRILQRGQSAEIRAGEAFIHSLFHLQHPSLSVVVRTREDPGTSPQFAYAPPSVSYDPFYKPLSLRRRIECLRALHKADPDHYAEVVTQVVEASDLFETFLVMNAAHALLERTPERFAELVTHVRRVHGELTLPLEAAWADMGRTRRIVKLREGVTDSEQRFLLALLLNVPDAQEILRLVEGHLPQQPAQDTVMRLLAEMAGSGKLGMKLDDTQMDLVGLMLEGLSEEEIVGRLKQDYEAPGVEARRADISRFCAQLRAQPLLQRLFN